MNIRLFLTGSSLVLLSWMAASYLKVSPEAAYVQAQPVIEASAEVVVNVSAELSQLTAQQ